MMRLAQLGLFTVALAIIPRILTAHTESALYDHDLSATAAFADQVAAEISSVNERNFRTGSKRFDFEWSFGTQQMAALGFAQIMIAHPELRSRYQVPLRSALRKMMAKETLTFGTEAWGNAGLPRAEVGHAYLGYANLSLGLARLADPGFEHTEVHDQLTASFVKQLEHAKAGLFETYPGESYPVDVASVVASIALHDRATHSTHAALLESWQSIVRQRYVDSSSGLLVQSAHAATGRAKDKPRSSGTALASYFLGVAQLPLGKELYESMKRCCVRDALGFGAVREYADNKGKGDIDSGPVVLGFGVSPTGFLIGAARENGDRATFLSLSRTANMFGMPTRGEAGWGYQTGGPIGDAIMLAMTTANGGES